MTTTCPVCGTTCRIEGDPASVTRWYEPVAQAELETAKERIEELELESARRMETLTAVSRTMREYLTERRVREKRIKELEAIRADLLARAALVAEPLPGVEGL